MTDSTSLESMVKFYMNSFLKSKAFCHEAKIVSTQNIDNGKVSVQPLNMRVYADQTVEPYPVIEEVPLITPQFIDSGMVVAPKKGDTVLLLFTQNSIDEFKMGDTEVHESLMQRFMNINNAVAVAGLTPFNRNALNPVRHYHDYNVGDVSIFNNLGTVKENKINVKKNGNIYYRAKKHYFEGDTDLKGNSNHQGNSYQKGTYSIDGDIIINGISLKAFINAHKHGFIDADGNPKITNVPNPL
jgi:hypothetical protein